jgi:hypothetical protein
MTKTEAIDKAGSQAKLARLLGVHRSAICQWKTIPQGRLFQLMLLKPEWFYEGLKRG